MIKLWYSVHLILMAESEC